MVSTVGQKETVEQYLQERGIRYRGVEHGAAASAEEYNQMLGTRYTQQVKVLLVKCKREGLESYCVLALQGHKKANLDAVKKLLKVTKTRLADREQLLQLTGCNFGELHPFASPHGLPCCLMKIF